MILDLISVIISAERLFALPVNICRIAFTYESTFELTTHTCSLVVNSPFRFFTRLCVPDLREHAVALHP